MMVSPLSRVRRPRSVIRWCRDHSCQKTACGCLHEVADDSAEGLGRLSLWLPIVEVKKFKNVVFAYLPEC